MGYYDDSNFNSEPNTGFDEVTPGGEFMNMKHGKVKRQPKTKNLKPRAIAALKICCMLISGVFGFGGAMIADAAWNNSYNSGAANTNNAKTTGFNLEDATGSEMTVQEITAATLDSVVEIKTESVQTETFMGQYVMQGAGSGVIIKSDGYIITNNHVIDGANKIVVTTTDETEYEASVVGADSDNDVAVLKINAKNLPAATLGNSDQLNVGDLAVAIGNPLGELGGTVTAGIISALDRSITIDGKNMSLLQTDTSINPGNSGGGLFNQYGQLIGVVVAKSSGSDVEGLGFAIPINTAANVAEQLIDHGYVSGKPSTGMAYQERTSQSGMFDSFFGGSSVNVYIAEVNGTNAKKAGFKAGDMVKSVNGQEIDSFDTLASIISSHKPGDKVTYVIVRDDRTIEIVLELSERTS